MATRGKMFHDPIHGSMEFDPVLVKIIDTPEFQRLRRIKQLGAGCYVYPGATHTRFEHSLGVCHLAGKFAEHLNAAAKAELGSEIFDNDEILCIKVAGLCHDLGHGPFSHMFEVFADKAVPNAKWEHEDMSVRILEKILEDVGEKRLIEKKDLIGKMIKGSKEESGEKHFLYQIVANKDTGIDVDKWDYFARDCHYLGLSNDFQWMRCMMLARVKHVGDNDYQICYRDSDVANIYAMFRTRSTLHQKAYQHIRVKAVEDMMVDCLLCLKDYTLPGLKKTLEYIVERKDVAEYVKLDDSIVESFQEPADAPEGSKIRKAFKLVERLRKRKLYRYLGFAKLKEEKTEEDIKQILPDMAHDDNVGISVVKVKFGSEKDTPLGNLWFYPKEKDPFQLSLEESKLILLGGLLLPLEYQLQCEARFYWKDENEDSAPVNLKERFKTDAAKEVFGEPTGLEGYFSMTKGPV